MCVAILSPENVTIPESHLKRSFEVNPDGAGFMYAEDNQLHIEKGFMTYEDFLEAYTPHETKAIAVHFRITTHGDTDEGNTHPFRVGSNLGFIHNGIINNVDCSADKTRSDTYHFNTKFLAPFYKRDSRFIFKEHFKDVIKSYIGYSKLVFLNNKGHHTIVNEDKGVWDEGVWYSNTSYRPFVAKVPAVKQSGYVKTTPMKDTIRSFQVGTRVTIEGGGYTGTGYIRYFNGGLMAGVFIPGDNEVTLVPLQYLSIAPEYVPYQTGDWVVKKGGDMDAIYTVTGVSKHTLWIQPLNYNAQGEGNKEIVDTSLVEEWCYLGGGV